MRVLLNHAKKPCLLAMGGILLWTLSGTAAWAGQIRDLKGIELTSSMVETQVVLKANEDVPYHVVSQSPDKIVIDLDSVDPNRSIPTDFTAAENVEQVILKPLASDKLRMVIRGEKLGNPIIESHTLHPHRAHKPQLVYQQEAVATPKSKSSHIKAPKDDGIAMIAADNPQTSELQSMETGSKDAIEETQGSTDSMDANSQESGPMISQEESDMDSSTPPGSKGQIDRQALVDRKHMESSEDGDEEAATWQDNMASGWDSFIASTIKSLRKIGPGIFFGLSGLIGSLTALALLLRRHLVDSSNPFEASMRQEQPSLLAQLTQLFGSKNRRSRQPQRRNGKRPFADQYQVQTAKRHPSLAAERPVGLQGLREIAPAPPTQASAPQSVNRNHALNQYARNAAAPVPEPPKRDRAELDREIKRSLQMQEAIQASQSMKPGVNARSAKPQPAVPPKPVPRAQQPVKPRYNGMPQNTASRTPGNLPKPRTVAEPGLPANNTEVLDFLRSVADLMEKDGRTDLARGIKRGITQPEQ